MQDYYHSFSNIGEAKSYAAFMCKHFLLAYIASAGCGQYTVVVMHTNWPYWLEKVKRLTDKFLSGRENNRRITGE